jgi:serine phosphatase RsbU (regulator of sigma subunit)
VAAAALGRLIEPAAIEPLLTAAAGLSPDSTIEVRDVHGERFAAHGDVVQPGRPTSSRSIVLGDEAVGTVIVTGSAPAEVLDAMATTVAAALSVAVAEASARRAVTAAALDDLRELSLLSRLAETIGAVVEPEQIAGRVLETIARPLHADVALVLPPEADGAVAPSIVAAVGDPGDVDRLARDARELVARLSAEDPILGTCADLDRPAEIDAFGSLLAAVVRTTRGTQGAIVLGRRPSAARFGDTDRRLLAAVASQTAIALERSALQREILGRRRLDDELAIGRRIQLSLMPRRFPTVPGWEIAAAYEAAREIGGDFYDVFPLRDEPGCLAFTVADVTGKGIPAAILMADVRGLIHAAADHGVDPVETLTRVNRILIDERATSLFVTVVLGVFDTATGDLTLSSAGHDPIHLLRADGSLTRLEPTGRLIGMVADIRAGAIETVVGSGDAIVAHTDGITEARSPDGAFFGEERFATLLSSLAGRSAADIVEAVIADVTRFRAGAEASDDLTLLVLRRYSDPG